MRVELKTSKYTFQLTCPNCSINSWVQGTDLMTCKGCGHQSLPPTWLKGGETVEGSIDLAKAIEEVEASHQRRFQELGELEAALGAATKAGDDGILERANLNRAKREFAVVDKLLEVMESLSNITGATAKGFLSLHVPELGQAWNFTWGGYDLNDETDRFEVLRETLQS